MEGELRKFQVLNRVAKEYAIGLYLEGIVGNLECGLRGQSLKLSAFDELWCCQGLITKRR